MNWLNLFFGIIGLLSFGFSIYTYSKSESKKMIESAKAAMNQERYKAIKNSLSSIFHTVDSIVQIPKQGDVNIEQIQHLARIVRGQIFSLGKQIEISQKNWENWKYGILLESSENLNTKCNENK